MSHKIHPPYSGDQIASFNAYQPSGIFHPFTCGTEDCRSNLLATRDGLRCARCDYQQQWVWDWMTDWSWADSQELPQGWWKLYPVRGNGWSPYPPDPLDGPDPRFSVGTLVRLQGRPQLVRRVVTVEWHWIRREYCYIVETSAEKFRPYWFAAQLMEVTA